MFTILQHVFTNMTEQRNHQPCNTYEDREYSLEQIRPESAIPNANNAQCLGIMLLLCWVYAQSHRLEFSRNTLR